MLYQVAQELAAALRAQHVPFRVVFGPERSDDLYAGAERVMIAHRGPNADTFLPPVSQHPNPSMPLVRHQGALLRIHARASMAGAAWHDHAERAEQVLDHVICELIALVRARKNTITFRSGGFIEPEDARGTDTQAGAVYELEFDIDRGIFRRTWEGDAAPTVKIGPLPDVPISHTTKVSTKAPPAGTPPPDAETAC